MDLPHQQNAEINDIQMHGNEEPKAIFTETNEHLKPEYKKYPGFKQNSIAVEPPYVNYEVPYWSFLTLGIYFTMHIQYSIKQVDDSK
jgi:hypothetical protein